MAEDARYRTKVFLDKYLDNANLTEDDGLTPAYFIVAYDKPKYPIELVFNIKGVDLVFSIKTPESIALPFGTGYKEAIPITIWCINKLGIMGTKLRWKAEKELRRIVETHPLGTLRTLDRLGDNEQNLGSTTLYSVEYILNYKRYAHETGN